jgi:Terminase large subunit, T4likevirus-type, N-terminal
MGRTRQGRTLNFGIAYDPLPSQGKFHESNARFKGFSGPIGSGKSQALCHEAIRLAYENPGRMGLIGAPTYPMLRDSTQRAVLEVLEENDLEYEFNKSANEITLKYANSKIAFRSLDDFERLRGTNLAWFGIDELTYAPEQAWLRLEGRLRDPKASRLCGFAVWTPKGFDWVYERFIGNPIAGYDTVAAKAYENRYVLDKVPDFYDRLKGSYDEKFFRQEVLGEYLDMAAGRVYYAFDRTKHLKAREAELEEPLLWALDFNVNPMCSIVAQVIKGTVWVHDEIVLNRASTENACEEFTRRFERHKGGLTIYGDASGQHMQTGGSTDYAIIGGYLGARGYWYSRRVPKSNPAVRDRVSVMNAMLESADGGTRLFVNPRCKELIKDLEQVVYLPDSAVIDKQRDPRRTHLSDALGYLVWQECRPQLVDPVERRGRLF